MYSFRCGISHRSYFKSNCTQSRVKRLSLWIYYYSEKSVYEAVELSRRSCCGAAEANNWYFKYGGLSCISWFYFSIYHVVILCLFCVMCVSDLRWRLPFICFVVPTPDVSSFLPFYFPLFRSFVTHIYTFEMLSNDLFLDNLLMYSCSIFFVEFIYLDTFGGFGNNLPSSNQSNLWLALTNYLNRFDVVIYGNCLTLYACRL